jgi:ankyrin repeat protein
MAGEMKSLITAAKKGDIAQARRLLRNHPNLNARDAAGLTPLMWAARTGHRKLVEAFLAAGADPNARDRTGQTALHHAVVGKHRRVIPALVKGKANVNLKDQDDCSPFELATLADDYETAKELSALGAKDPAPDPGLISIGQFRGSRKHQHVQETIELLSLRLAELPEHNPWGKKGHLRVTFLIPGSGRNPGFDGVHKGAFSKKNRILEVQIAVPKTLTKKWPIEFLLASMHKAVDLAEGVYKRAKIKFDTVAIREHLFAIEVMKNWEFPDFGGQS